MLGSYVRSIGFGLKQSVFVILYYASNSFNTDIKFTLENSKSFLHSIFSYNYVDTFIVMPLFCRFSLLDLFFLLHNMVFMDWLQCHFVDFQVYILKLKRFLYYSGVEMGMWVIVGLKLFLWSLRTLEIAASLYV